MKVLVGLAKSGPSTQGRWDVLPYISFDNAKESDGLLIDGENPKKKRRKHKGRFELVDTELEGADTRIVDVATRPDFE